MASLSALFFVCISAIHYVPSTALCINYMSCYNENFLDYDQLEIYHEDLEESSATACAEVCARERPATLLVFAKLIEMNERLACGCGEEAALGNRSGTLSEYLCEKCPDSNQMCGGHDSISVYQIYHKEGECKEVSTAMRQTTSTPATTTINTSTMETTQPTPLMDIVHVGCYRDDSMVQVDLVYLQSSSATAYTCAVNCKSENPHEDLYMIKHNATGLLCGCGRESSLGELTPAPESQCDSRCGDPELPCGGLESLSVFRNACWVARASWPLLLLLAVLARAL